VRILIIHPDPATAAAIDLMLASEGFNVYATHDADDGAELGKLYDYDGIVLADVFGAHDVLAQLRTAKVKSAVLRLSALNDVKDIVAALDAGADDYLTTPFDKNELIARLHAIVRRSKGHAVSVIEIGNLLVNISAKTVTVDGSPVHFTGKEYAMVELMALRKGMTISKEVFLNHLYGGMDEPEAKIIDVFICKIRKKLRDARGHDVETVWGRGYVLRDTPKLAASPSMVPELQEMIDDPLTKYIKGGKTVREYRQEAIVSGYLKSPTLVPEAGQK